MAEHNHNDDDQIEEGESTCSSCDGDPVDFHATPQQAEPNIDAPSVTRLAVAGVDCPDEAKLIHKALEPIQGVGQVDVNVLTGRVTIGHETQVEVSTLIASIDKTGLKASIFKQPSPSTTNDKTSSAQKQRLIVVIISALTCGLGLLLSWQKLAPPSTTLPLFVIAIISGGWFIYPKAWAALQRFQADMNLLMTIAVIGAAFIGEWSESAMVVLLFSISEQHCL